jgi:hypothetical protein
MTDSRRHDDSLLEKHTEEEMERYQAIVDRLTKIEERQTEMLEVWTQAKGALQFIKILAALGVAIAGIYSFFTSNFTVIPK